MRPDAAKEIARRFIALPPEKQRIFLQQLQAQGVDFAQFPIPAGIAGERRKPVLSYAQSGRGARYRFVLDGALTQRLQTLARDRGVTLFTLLLAAFQVLLFRQTGQRDIRVGVPIANRSRAETAGLIGFFVNTQVLRTELDAGDTVLDLLDKVREAALDAQAHQELPFEQLVEALQPERSLSHSPLFQVMYNHQRTDAATLPELPGLQIETLARDEHSTPFDLTLDTFEEGEKLSALLTYSTDLFEQTTIARLAGHWCNLLQAMAENPAQRIGCLPMLSAAEHEQLHRWGRQRAAYPLEPDWVARVAERVARHPQRTVARCGEASLNYAELWARSGDLARGLAARGVGPDTLVALLFERGLDWLVSMVAVLRAGGAWIPLDPGQPPGRWKQILAQAGQPLLVCDEPYRATLAAHRIENICSLDDLRACSGLADPGRTAAAFVPHPCGAAGERLYLSGDLACGRGAGIRRAQGLPGQAAGVADRAGRNRSGAGASSRRAPGAGPCRAGGQPGNPGRHSRRHRNRTLRIWPGT